MEHILEEANGSILAAFFSGIFLVFIIFLFSRDSEVAEYVRAFLITIGGTA